MRNKLPSYNRENALIGNLGLGNQVANFEGAEYLTITKTQTITDEYQLFFESEFVPEAPDGNEMLFRLESNKVACYYTTTKLKLDSAEFPNFEVGDINLGVINSLKVYVKVGLIKTIFNGVEAEFSKTITAGVVYNYTVGSGSGLYFPMTGLIQYFKDQTETWNFANQSLTGSLGTTAVLTGTEAVLFKYFIAQDQGLNTNYMKLEGGSTPATATAIFPNPMNDTAITTATTWTDATSFTYANWLLEDNSGVTNTIFIDPNTGKRSIVYSTAQTGSDLTRALRFTNQ